MCMIVILKVWLRGERSTHKGSIRSKSARPLPSEKFYQITFILDPFLKILQSQDLTRLNLDHYIWKFNLVPILLMAILSSIILIVCRQLAWFSAGNVFLCGYADDLVLILKYRTALLTAGFEIVVGNVSKVVLIIKLCK